MSSLNTSTSALLTVALSRADARSAPSAAPAWGAPTITNVVTNISPNPITLLRWSSPLDPLALQLGLLHITPAGSDIEMEIPTVMVSRQLPPGREDLVTLGPGESKAQEIELKDIFVPKEKLFPQGDGGQAKVVCKGEWMAVWPGLRGDEIDDEALQLMGAHEKAVKGEYESGPLEISPVL